MQPSAKSAATGPGGNDPPVVAGHGWNADVVGFAISVADDTSPQGRVFNPENRNSSLRSPVLTLITMPAFYCEHAVLSTVDVLVAAKIGPTFGVREADSQVAVAFSEGDIDFLTGFATLLAEAVSASVRAETARPNDPSTIVAFEGNLAQFAGGGCYTVSATLFIPTGQAVASLQFEQFSVSPWRIASTGSCISMS